MENRKYEKPKRENDFGGYLKKTLCFIGKTIGNMLGSVCWFIKTLIAFITISFICGCFIAGAIYIKMKPDLDSCMEIAYDKLSSMKESDFYKPMDTFIYDKDGNTIGIINAGHFEYVQHPQVPGQGKFPRSVLQREEKMHRLLHRVSQEVWGERGKSLREDGSDYVRHF